MKHMKTVEVPATTREAVEKVTCDLCGHEIKRARWSADEVTIRRRTGFSYPEGGGGDDVSFDLCGPCFDTKLTPWLVSLGAVPVKSVWDC